MSARNAILAKVRQASGNAGSYPREKDVEDRLNAPPRGIIPARGQLAVAERLDLFQTEAERVSAVINRLESLSEVAAAIADYLRANNLPQRIRTGDDQLLAAVDWSSQPNLEVLNGPSAGDDEVCVSRATVAIAETGTLVMTSGSDNPTTLNFLPDHHLVVLMAEDIEGDYEAAFAVLRDKFGKNDLPRTVNFITGPSRSADIEQTLLLGAHGPRKLQILLVGR